MSAEFKRPENPLGECVHVFKPAQVNIIAGFILSALLLVGGLAAIALPLREAHLAGWDLPIHIKQGWCWLAVGFSCLIGLALLVLGILLSLYVQFLLSHRVEACVNGFRYCAGHSVECVLWADISLIRETTLYERPPILKGPAKFLVPKMASTSYTVIVAGGKEYGFDGNSVKSINELGQVLRDHANRLSLPWECVEKHT